MIDKSKIFGYDFEVLSSVPGGGWFCVTFINYEDRSKEITIINDRNKLLDFYNNYKDCIFISYNGRQYDTGIFKSILEGSSFAIANDKLIKEGKKPFQVVKNFKKYQLYDYDTIRKDASLKQLEAFMGDDIRETEVPFDLEREPTETEVEQMRFYNIHDVKEMLKVLDYAWDDFEGQLDIIELYGLDMSYISKMSYSCRLCQLVFKYRAYAGFIFKIFFYLRCLLIIILFITVSYNTKKCHFFAH